MTTQTALADTQITAGTPRVLTAIKDRVVRAFPRDAAFGNLVVITFLVSQALDGIFTYLGIATVGLTEGNPLIAYSFRHAGVGPGLAGAKLLAAGCAMILHLFGLHRTLALLVVVYLSCAVIPWTYLIFFAR